MLEAEQHWQPPPPYSAEAGIGTPHLGQVAGIGRGEAGTVWALHRGDRVWDAQSFEGASGERTTYKTPIAADVVLQLDQESGAPPAYMSCSVHNLTYYVRLFSQCKWKLTMHIASAVPSLAATAVTSEDVVLLTLRD